MISMYLIPVATLLQMVIRTKRNDVSGKPINASDDEKGKIAFKATLLLRKSHTRLDQC